MATIKEISEKANVSIATVSNVLNEKPGVKKETIEKVLAVADELNYRPNLFARSLKRGQSHTLGIITEDLTVFNTPEIVDGIDDYCEKNDYHYILGNLRLNKLYGKGMLSNTEETSKRLHSVLDTMLSKQVDGIIYIGCHSHAIFPIHNKEDVPIVYAYCYSSDASIPSVLYDDQKAAYNATKLLIEKGHKKIGVLAGLPESTHTANRILGYQEALYSSNIPYNPALTVNGKWTRESGKALAGELIEKGATAIFAHNDLIAVGVIEYCNSKNIQVGKDIALIGFDNREIGTVCSPALSTVSLPLFEIGQSSAHLLLDILLNKQKPKGQKIMLACEIVERDSTNAIINN